MKPVKLTQTVITKAEPPPFGEHGQSKQKFLRDSSIPGFGLRITSNGVRSFIVEKRINGVVKRHTIGRVGAVELSLSLIHI